MEQNYVTESTPLTPAREMSAVLAQMLTTRAFGALRLIAGAALLSIGLALGILSLLGIFGVARKVHYLIALSAISLFSGVRLLILGGLIVFTGRD